MVTTKEENEKMLKVIEKNWDGSTPWSDTMQNLVPLLYSIAITNATMGIMSKSLKETFKNDKRKKKL